jgi:hypothetical protein
MNSVLELCKELNMLSSCFRKYSSSPVGILCAQNAIKFFLSIFVLRAAISKSCNLQYFRIMILEILIFLWMYMQTPLHCGDVLHYLAPSL